MSIEATDPIKPTLSNSTDLGSSERVILPSEDTVRILAETILPGIQRPQTDEDTTVSDLSKRLLSTSLDSSLDFPLLGNYAPPQARELSAKEKQSWFNEELTQIGQIDGNDQMTRILSQMKERKIDLFDACPGGTYFSKLAAAATPTPLCVLLSAAILHEGAIPPLLADEIKRHLLTIPFDNLLLATILKDPNANEIFDRLFHILNQDDINNNDELKNLILKFAFTVRRYNYLYLQPTDFDGLRLHLVRFQEANQVDPSYVKKLLSNKKWMNLRASSSTTFAAVQTPPPSWQKANDFLFATVETDFSLTTIADTHRIMTDQELAPSADDDVDVRGRYRFELIDSRGKGIVRTGTWQQLYCIPTQLQRNLTDFEEWMDASIQECDGKIENPIILSGQAYQRFLSLHPFMNGNGRMSRLVMDWILTKYHLPPPLLDGQASGLEPVFPLAQHRVDPGLLLRRIVDGIKDSKNFTFED